MLYLAICIFIYKWRAFTVLWSAENTNQFLLLYLKFFFKIFMASLSLSASTTNTTIASLTTLTTIHHLITIKLTCQLFAVEGSNCSLLGRATSLWLVWWDNSSSITNYHRWIQQWNSSSSKSRVPTWASPKSDDPQCNYPIFLWKDSHSFG